MRFWPLASASLRLVNPLSLRIRSASGRRLPITSGMANAPCGIDGSGDGEGEDDGDGEAGPESPDGEPDTLDGLATGRPSNVANALPSPRPTSARTNAKPPSSHIRR